jgi:Fe-S cluster biogenesis protein NfuA
MPEENALYQRVSGIIEKEIRPFIEADGGQIQLKEVMTDGTVYVQLAGACAGCPGAAMTLKAGVERILRMKVDGVKEVKLAY